MKKNILTTQNKRLVNVFTKIIDNFEVKFKKRFPKGFTYYIVIKNGKPSVCNVY
jgi:hypothetical protein